MTCTKGTPAVFPSGSGPDVDWPVYKVTVDAQTWLPVRFQELEAGVLIAELRTRTCGRQAAARGRVHPAGDAGLSVRHTDGGFRRITLEEAGDLRHLTPLVPGFSPGGYTLTAVALATRR